MVYSILFFDIYGILLLSIVVSEATYELDCFCGVVESESELDYPKHYLFVFCNSHYCFDFQASQVAEGRKKNQCRNDASPKQFARSATLHWPRSGTFKIFQAIIDVFRDVIRDGEANRQLIQRFRANTFGIDFYFGDDVIAFHKKIETAIHDLAYVSMKVNDVINGRREHADHEENVDKQSKLLDEVLNLNNELFSVFKPYLDFSNYKVRK